MMSAQTFKATVTFVNDKVLGIVLPFDPNTAWSVKERHHVSGTIDEHAVRGALARAEGNDQYYLALGPAWLRDTKIEHGRQVSVTLAPEGPLQSNAAPDISEAFSAAPAALAFFEALPTFYRKNYMRWIDSAKRPVTRTARIAEMITLLKDGKRER